MKNVLYLLSYGLLFGFGLIIAGMTNPAKVLAFLDVAGAWDPSLALVMASALLTLAAARWLMAIKSGEGLASRSNSLPQAAVDRQLIVGSAIFGIGWGLSGFCPGPALIGLTAGDFGNYLFVVSMFIGFWICRLLHGR